MSGYTYLRGDTREIPGRYQGDAREMQVRCKGDAREIQGRRVQFDQVLEEGIAIFFLRCT